MEYILRYALLAQAQYFLYGLYAQNSQYQKVRSVCLLKDERKCLPLAWTIKRESCNSLWKHHFLSSSINQFVAQWGEKTTSRSHHNACATEVSSWFQVTAWSRGGLMWCCRRGLGHQLQEVHGYSFRGWDGIQVQAELHLDSEFKRLPEPVS